ncbi:hypothetical protein MMC11_004110 [Xylographa trunciseda]|nr:hypothetical protein [Xylographa trunciseda]
MPQTRITDNNLAPLVDILTWFLLVTSITGVAVRGATKAVILHIVGLDDALITIALSKPYLYGFVKLFSIGQSSAVAVQTANGFGKPISSLASSVLLTDLKAEYAANLLYIAGLCFSKLSVLAMIKTITPARRDQILVYGLIVTVIAWALTGELAAAFQCQAQRPFDYVTGTCFNRTAWMNYLEITNIITDVTLIVLPFFIIWNVKTSMMRKASVFLVFALRIFVMAVSICKLVYWNRLSTSADSTLDLWPVAICTELIQCLEILAACCLYLKPFLESLESGFIRGGDLRRRGEDSLSVSGHRTASIPLSYRRTRSSVVDRNLTRSRNTTTAERFDPDDDTESLNSRSQIIWETRTWAVETSTDVPRESQFIGNILHP